jgi:putative transposase
MIRKSATGKYFASILVETTGTLPVASTIEAAKTTGINLSLEHMLIQSGGEKTENTKYLRKAQKRKKISHSTEDICPKEKRIQELSTPKIKCCASP